VEKMNKKIFIIIVLLTALCVISSAVELRAPVFLKMNVEGIIDIANADYVQKGIEQAEKENDEGVLITMQTPGGLDKSMRKITDAFLNSTVPVIVYVYPKASRAASAGAFILLASHVAAMAEGTNIGTAHPVDYNGSAVSEKITNDSVAYIKNLARLKGRNEQWASNAILKNVSSSEVEALKLKVIDLIAKDPDELMKKLDKWPVRVGDKKVILDTKGYIFKEIKPTSKHVFLHYLSDPNIVYVLFLIGIYGLIYELANAGTVIFPGIAGAIALVLAFTGFESLPINVAGAILIGLSALLFFVDVISPTHGVLTLGGIVSLIIGSLLLFPARGQGSAFAASYLIMGTMVLLTILFFALIVAAVFKAMKRKSITGTQSLVGLRGVAKTGVQEAGVVNVGGEEWQAYSDEKIDVRDVIEVLEVNGMKLKVKKIPRKKEE
jgi:membrane-bound serine protease (ClpP class)